MIHGDHSMVFDCHCDCSSYNRSYPIRYETSTDQQKKDVAHFLKFSRYIEYRYKALDTGGYKIKEVIHCKYCKLKSSEEEIQ